MQAYGVFKHRHRPEITEHAGIPTIFTPHLGCYDRGILATVHLELKPGTTEAQVRAAFDAAYTGRPFVRVLKAGRWPSVAAVERTNFCDIGFALETSAHGTHLIGVVDRLPDGRQMETNNVGMIVDRGAAGYVLEDIPSITAR